jgi:hypothetical protein
MNRLVPASLASMLILAAAPAQADHCPTDKLGAMPDRLAEDGTAVAWRTNPAKIAVNRPFSIEVIACVDGEKQMAPTRISVNAGMPMHGHGMNYTPSEKKLAPGNSTFDGMVFHMPGKWQLTFDVYEGETRKRLTRNVTVRR